METVAELKKPAAKRTKQEIEVLIEQWRKSGKTKKDFCQDYPLNYQTFIGWTKKKKKELTLSKKTSSNFIPLEVTKESRAVFAEIRLSNGNSVIIHEYVGTGYLRSLLV